MSASYPAQIWTPPPPSSLSDGVDIVEAAHVNLLRLEVLAIQNELGTDPAGSFSTVKDFLNNLNTTRYKAGDTLLASGGSAATPGLGFNVEVGLGVFRASPGVVALAAGGVERLRASSSGVTIPQATVTGNLTVSGALQATGTISGISHSVLGSLTSDTHPQYFTQGRHDTHDHSNVMSSVALSDLGSRSVNHIPDHNATTHNALGITHGSLSGLLSDDHPDYLTEGRHNLLAGGHVTGGDAHNHLGGAGGAQVDHGGLAGLLDDDHTQYLTTTRHTNLAGAHVTNGDNHDHYLGEGAQIDHGRLAGLGDNDHSQYAQHAIAQTIAGGWNFTNYLRLNGLGVVRGNTSASRTISSSTNGPSGGSDGDIHFEW